MKSYRVREKVHEALVPDLLHARGVSEESHKAFLMPDYEAHSHDPFLMPDMEKAVERIRAAARAGETVAVWSDYDADGIPGGVMLAEFLRDIGCAVEHYIPHRHEEGFGLNTKGLAVLKDKGVSLVITVDLGTGDVEPIAFANAHGMEVIVTDHHLPPDVLPQAFAVVNPKRIGSAYPFPHLCGAGVAWKLVQAVLQKDRFGFGEGREKWLLDLVGMATLSDMVPLTGENRMLAHYGLTVLRKTRRPGLSSLLSLLRINRRTLTEDDVGFMISPRINAASRMDRPETAAALLAAADEAEGALFARALNKVNDERKGVVAATVKEVRKRLAAAPSTSGILVMGNPHWRPGVLGLVANSLAESEGRPVCLWGREGGDTIRGSCRSDGVTNVVALMKEAEDVFEEYGGHAFSGGFSVSEENIHGLAERLGSAYAKLTTASIVPEVLIDRALEVADANERTLKEVRRLAPFGTGNEKPLFVFPNASITGMRQFGKNKDHLELSFERDGARASGIAFFSAPDAFQKTAVDGARADIVGHVEHDWRGKARVRVVDII